MDTFLLERGPLSRGSFIITQKENKGEYRGVGCDATNCYGGYVNNNDTWKWNNSTYDWDIYAHAFDQNGKYRTTDNIPIRYPNNSTDYWSSDNIPQCTNDEQTTNGKIEYTSTSISEQLSCNPSTLNAGNWYNFPAATAGSNNASTSTETNMPNSICPKGWQLPPNSGNKSYYNLIHDKYLITDTVSDTNFLANSAMSFIRLGRYDSSYGSLNNRGGNGHYWSSTAYSATTSRLLRFHSGHLNPQYSDNRANGYAIRCVSR